MELAKIARRRATDEVYDALRQAILTHVFRPGDRLVIDEIAAKLGVSLTPVRHAIQQLATEGLVSIHPRTGTYVAMLSSQDVEETFEIRCALESLAAELAAQRLTAEQLSDLRRILESLALPVDDEEGRKRHELDNRRFHLLIMEASGNRRLAEMYQSLNAHLQIARVHGANTDWAARLPQEHAEHVEIVAALESRDGASAAQAMKNHIDRAKRSLSRTLGGAA